MLLKFLLKIWPALMPILLYLSWVFIIQPILKKIKRKNIIEGNFEELNSPSKKLSNHDFSLKNRNFIIMIYLSLVLMIICFLFFASRTPHIESGQYIPAESKNGKIISGRIISQSE